MTKHLQHTRDILHRVQRRLAVPGGQHSPSELAIRSIDEKRSTPRW